MPVFFLFFTRLRECWVGEAAQFHAELRVFEGNEVRHKEAQEAQSLFLILCLLCLFAALKPSLLLCASTRTPLPERFLDLETTSR